MDWFPSKWKIWPGNENASRGLFRDAGTLLPPRLAMNDLFVGSVFARFLNQRGKVLGHSVGTIHNQQDVCRAA
ncbi:hypothetical protein [Novipirellula sp.]|uniref:hypothetical protein n=1 Tax=Novipirellula sp. TaxID=2795430 RepID=UPI003567FA86